jgi:hypothetical protein
MKFYLSLLSRLVLLALDNIVTENVSTLSIRVMLVRT